MSVHHARPGGRKLTDRQRAIFDWIARHVAEHGRPPSVRAIAAEFGIASPNGVACHLKALEKKGLIERRQRPYGSRRSGFAIADAEAMP